MAYEKHALVAIQGVWTAPDMVGEVWQVGIRVSTHAPSGWWLANPQTYADAIGPNIDAWFHTGTIFNQLAQLTAVKVNNINPDGTYHDPVTHQHALTQFGGVVGPLPAFCSLAATLETGRSTGRARRGRIYLPTTATMAAGNAVKVSAASRDAVRDKVKALLTILAINEPTGGLLVFPAIASKIDASINDITGVSANDVLDVQRRRKNRIRGTRSAIAAFP